MLSAEEAAQAHRSNRDHNSLCTTFQIDITLDVVAPKSVNKGWLPSLQLETIELDTSNIEWQTELHKRATDADSVSTFVTKPINNTTLQEQHKPEEISEINQETPKKYNLKLNQKTHK